MLDGLLPGGTIAAAAFPHLARMRIPLAATVAVLMCAAPAASAQSAAADPPARQAVSVNLLLLPFEIYQGEYEHVVGAGGSIGVAANYVGLFDEGDYLSVDGKLRYYPNERALRGFSIGGSLGLTRVTDDAAGCAVGGPEPCSESAVGFALGVVLDYNWLLGRQRHFFVGTGIGAKRLFIGDESFDTDLSLGYPTARLQVGYAF